MKPIRQETPITIYGSGAGSMVMFGDASADAFDIVIVNKLTEPTLQGGTLISRMNNHTLNHPPAQVTSRKFAIQM